jgi:hypothetical protein
MGEWKGRARISNLESFCFQIFDLVFVSEACCGIVGRGGTWCSFGDVSCLLFVPFFVGNPGIILLWVISFDIDTQALLEGGQDSRLHQALHPSVYQGDQEQARSED